VGLAVMLAVMLEQMELQILQQHLDCLPLDQAAAAEVAGLLFLAVMVAMEDSPLQAVVAVGQLIWEHHQEEAEMVAREWQLLQPIFNMIERYVILNADGGWLENTILWDGNTETWQPPQGTIVKLESEVNFSTLPLHPDILNDPVEIIIDIEEAGSY
jgi:hypothetical protein